MKLFHTGKIGRVMVVLALVLSMFCGLGQGKVLLPGMMKSGPAAGIVTKTLDLAVAEAIPGGVAFRAVARGKDGLVVVGMRYDSGNDVKDGNRLIVIVRDRNGKQSEVRGSIPDWQMVPIAQFVDSPHDSLVDLHLVWRVAYGKHKGAEGPVEAIKDRPGFVAMHSEGQKLEILGFNLEPLRAHAIECHEKVKDTLLGYRLVQADALFLFPELMADLPKEEDGSDLLRTGETAPNARLVFARTGFLLRAAALFESSRCATYVICDEGQPVTFEIAWGKLRLTGSPVWWCWRPSPDGAVMHDEAVSDELTALMTENQGGNPVVYASLQTTMQYSALFRSFKANAPERFKEFLASIKDVGIEKIETPGRFEPAK